MTDSLSLNTNLLNAPLGTAPQSFSAPQTTSTSLFSPIQTSNSYTNDFMMSGFDFDSLSYDPQSGSIFQQKPLQNPQQAQSATLPTGLNNGVGTQTFTSNPIAQNPQQQGITQTINGQPNFSELDNYLVKDTKSEKKSNTCKIVGTTLGFLAPVAERVVTGMKSGSILKSLNFKQLAVTCPIIALAGYGIGHLADGIINSNKKAQQENTPTGQTMQTQIPQQV